MNLKQLSLELGLSQTTISRALNGFPEVSEATRNRVQLAADRHQYSPSTRAKGLATGKALAIGHVIPVSTKHEKIRCSFGKQTAHHQRGHCVRGRRHRHRSGLESSRELILIRALVVVIIGPSEDETRI